MNSIKKEQVSKKKKTYRAENKGKMILNQFEQHSLIGTLKEGVGPGKMKTDRVIHHREKNSSDLQPIVSRLDISHKYRYQSINNNQYMDIYDGTGQDSNKTNTRSNNNYSEI